MRPSPAMPGTARSCNCPPYTGSGELSIARSAIAFSSSTVSAARASLRNMEVASALPSGGWPRPSFRWQLWQARALNRGPSPSDAWVEEGDDTQSLRNSALPSLKVPSSSKVMLAEDCENASWLGRFFEVPAPPCISSNCSGFEKSFVGLVIASTRARSFGVRSVRVVGRFARSPARTGAVSTRLARATKPCGKRMEVRLHLRRKNTTARRMVSWS